ncbi:hypothetical protein H5410_028091 [Solanum commersonii]|uniref:Uncharacterized protein n=1 Tax=Solanum commersonii TaxID=4109 RepID=A0A9J5Z3Z2_SOLCO|nr:hypothetical protein H5410_028091 [Solanum commersonii]
MSETITKNRKKLMNPHTAGKKSCALIRSKLENEKNLYSLRSSLWSQEQENLIVCTRHQMRTQLAEMEEIEKQMSTNGQSVDAF